MERDVEEQLKTSLMYDDKEKLRRKLEILQREYVKTAEKLKRAERLEAVRHHVKNRIIQQNHQEQRDTEVNHPPLRVDPTATSSDNDDPRRNHVLRFLLPSDSSCQQSPDPCPDGDGGQRLSPALRLRSRRSRLRLERQSSEAFINPDNSEDAEEKGKDVECFKTEREVEEIQRAKVEVKSEEEGIVNKTEEYFSGSTSLMMSHWQTHPYTNKKGKQTEVNIEKREDNEKKFSEPSTLLVKHRNIAESTEQTSQVCTLKRKRKQKEERNDVESNIHHRENRYNNSEQSPTDNTENERCVDNNMEVVKERRSGGLLDSCTLVEGLIFPAEYYVRTTRRMTLSQTQPDMKAVIQSQLNMGRHRRSRTRGRGEKNSSPMLQPSSGHKPANKSLVDGPAQTSEDLQNSCEVSPSQSTEQNQSPPGSSTAAARRDRREGMRARRGRQTPLSGPERLEVGEQMSESPPPSTPLSFSPSLSDDSRPFPPEPGTEGCQTRLHCSTPSQHAPADSEDQSSPAFGHQQNVYPMFLRRSRRGSTSSQRSHGKPSCHLLLPPSPFPVQSPVLPPSISGLKNLFFLETQQDFHLPDDQFASLKLQKLQQVLTEAGVEHYHSPFCNTPSSTSRELMNNYTKLSVPLPLSLTPTITNPQESAVAEKKILSKGSSDRWFPEETLSNIEDIVQPEKIKSQPGSGSLANQSAAAEPNSDTQNDRPQTPPSDSLAETPVRERNHKDTGQSPGCRTELSERRVDNQRPSAEHSDCGAVIRHLSFDWPLQETPVIGCTAARSCDLSKAAGESPRVRPLIQDLQRSPCHEVTSQLVFGPSLATAPQPSPAPVSPPALPSVGLTPLMAPPLTPSPTAPVLSLAPSPLSPSTFTLSPPALSPCPSLTSSISRDSLVVPCSQIQAQLEPRASDRCHQQVEHQSQDAHEHEDLKTETLKTPSGGRLVDACCLSGPSGRLYVAAAGKWAVCLWSRTETSDWTLMHTWTFGHPVINVFSVPDAVDLMFVTLGQLEIREVWTLSCRSFSQMVLSEGVVQAAVGVYKSRVVTSSHSSSGSALQVFHQSDHSRRADTLSLVSPGVCVGFLAPVEGLPDALIGSNEAGRFFIWHLETGQLLRTLLLNDDLKPSACLRGFSYGGALFVLLQHQDQVGEEMEEEEQRKGIFSIVAINPLNRKSTVLTELSPPRVWSGRLCEADVSSSSVVGLSQSGWVCVWDLLHGRAPRMVLAQEKEGWQLARWGVGGVRATLLTAHHSGDVTLHHFSQI